MFDKTKNMCYDNVNKEVERKEKENLLTRKEDSDVNKVVIRQITETIKKEGGMKTMIPAQFVDNISGLHER